jgi:hypothetical protein
MSPQLERLDSTRGIHILAGCARRREIMFLVADAIQITAFGTEIMIWWFLGGLAGFAAAAYGL